MANIPDVSINRIRSDFEKIFNVHRVKVTLVRDKSNSEAGNYGSVGEPSQKLIKEIEICVQGASSRNYSRQKYGIDSTQSVWKCYARWNEDIRNEDRIVWDNTRFIIKNANDAVKGINTGNREESVGFIEFDLASVDKDDNSFYTNQ